SRAVRWRRSRDTATSACAGAGAGAGQFTVARAWSRRKLASGGTTRAAGSACHTEVADARADTGRSATRSRCGGSAPTCTTWEAKRRCPWWIARRRARAWETTRLGRSESLGAIVIAPAHHLQVLAVPSRRHALARRVRTGRIATRRDPLLAPGDDVPILSIGDIPERDRVGRIEIRVVLVLRREHPFRFDDRPPHTVRFHQIVIDVIRMDAEHEIRHERVIERATPIVLRQRRQQASTGAPADRRAFVGRADLHVPAKERPLDQVVRPALIRKLERELRVNHRTVQALRVVLEDDLPVRSDLVTHAMANLEPIEVEAHEPRHHRREPCAERLTLFAHTREKKTRELSDARRVEWELALVEPLDLLHVRRADETAVGRVGPRVVRTLNR